MTSFVSKYLHFHSPIVPIFDSRAQAAIRKLVDRKYRTLVREARTALPETGWSLRCVRPEIDAIEYATFDDAIVHIGDNLDSRRLRWPH